MFNKLLISSPNNGGLFYIDGQVCIKLDSLSSTGISYSEGTLLRALQPDILNIYLDNEFTTFRGCFSFKDIHDVLLFDNFYYIVSTQENKIFKLSKEGEISKIWSFPGGEDSLHINCLGVWNKRVVFSAFGEFTSPRGYKGLSEKAGFVQDLLSGVKLISGLSQPHSLCQLGENLLVANSEKMELLEFSPNGTQLRSLGFNGYTRGICVTDNNIYLGLSSSRNIDFQGIEKAIVVSLDKDSFREKNRLMIDAKEIYDIRFVEDKKRNLFSALSIEALREKESQMAELVKSLGERDDSLAERDQILAERDQMLAERDLQIYNTLQSNSWRLTKPLRYFRRQFSRVDLQFQLLIKTLVDIFFKSSFRTISFFAQIIIWLSRSFCCLVIPKDFSTQPINQYQYVPLISSSPLENKAARLICFYLPQYHPIPENDAWWGAGFTEWVGVKPANPIFEGHYQPHIPGELGYYSLLDSAVQYRQVELAKLYGISGFCFYFYWFAGKRLLDTPVRNYLDNSDLDFPFCLCWANENWTRRWDGRDNELLITQKHSVEDDMEFIKHISQYMRDPRYIRIDGKPLLLVYRPKLLPSAKDTAKRWRDWCRLNGVGEIHLTYTQSFETVDPREYGFDSAVEFPPNNSSPPDLTRQTKLWVEGFDGKIFDWRVFIDRSKSYKNPAYKLFRAVNPSWDNTARRKNSASIFAYSSPSGYQEWLLNAIIETKKRFRRSDEQVIFINAWNEWAEGAHLEPDQKYGYAYLEATRLAQVRAMQSLREEKEKLAIIIHAFYPDLLDEIIFSLPTKFKKIGTLFVSTTPENYQNVREILKGHQIPYQIFVFENLGRDVLPFLKILPIVKQAGYDFILKLHTKKSSHRMDGHVWRNDLYEKLLNESFANQVFNYLSLNHSIGIIGPEGYVVDLSNYWGMNQHKVEFIGRRLGLDHLDIKKLNFVAGTMFFARFSAFEPLLNLALSDEDFELETGQLDGTMAHAIERALALSAYSLGLDVVSSGFVVKKVFSHFNLESFYKPKRSS